MEAGLGESSRVHRVCGFGCFGGLLGAAFEGDDGAVVAVGGCVLGALGGECGQALDVGPGLWVFGPVEQVGDGQVVLCGELREAHVAVDPVGEERGVVFA